MNIEKLLENSEYKQINQMIKTRRISLDDVVDSICRLNASYIYLEAVANIDGLRDSILNEHHILRLGIKFKCIVFKRKGCFCDTFEFHENELVSFLNRIPNAPNTLVDDYANFISSTDKFAIIASFINDVDNIPASANAILANHIAKMLNVYKLIDINDIMSLLGNYKWYRKINGVALDIIAKPIIETNELEKILRFATGIKENYSFPKVWEDLTDKVILLLGNNLEEIYKFAVNHPYANKAKLVNVLINEKSFKWVYKFAKDIENIPENIMQTIVTYVASTLSPEFIYLFLNNINLSVENIKILTDAIMKTENADYIGYSIISLGRKEIIETIKNNEKLTKEQKAEQIAKLGEIKSQLIAYLMQMGKLDFLSNYNTGLPKELEEKLLNSDASIENPFAQDEDAKRMKLEGDAE